MIDAYEVLSDPQRRVNYDRTHASLFHTVTFDYREFLRRRRKDYVSQTRLIFYDRCTPTTTRRWISTSSS